MSAANEHITSSEDLLAIVQCGDPILRRRAEPLTASDLASSELRRLVERMRASMRAAPGVGLAAPQIGEGIQLAVLEDGPDRWGHLSEAERRTRERDLLPFTVLVNPSWQPLDDDQVGFYEGCLSVPGLTGFVVRHRALRVKALDEHGQPVDRIFRGWAARIVQHELDHLDGRLYLDRVETRSLSTVENYSRLWAGRPTEEASQALDFPIDSTP